MVMFTKSENYENDCFFPERARAQGSLCPVGLCPSTVEGSEKVGELKCRKNAVKMEGTSKNAGKIAF